MYPKQHIMHGRYGYYHLGVFPGNQINELAIANTRFYQLICRLHLQYIFDLKNHIDIFYFVMYYLQNHGLFLNTLFYFHLY